MLQQLTTNLELSVRVRVLINKIILPTFSFFHFSFSRKKNCEFAELRLYRLFRNVVVVSNLQ